MLTRAEVGGWKHPQKTSEASAGSQRGHSSLSTGKPCTWRRATAYQVLQSTTLLNVKAVNTVRCHAGRKRGEIPDRRSPCAVKVARTVTTGGMERRVKRYRALSLPTGDYAELYGSLLRLPERMAVLLADTPVYRTPFASWTDLLGGARFDKYTHVPKWWDLYNGSKHRRIQVFPEFTLTRTIDALAGALMVISTVPAFTFAMVKHEWLPLDRGPETDVRDYWQTLRGQHVTSREWPFAIATQLLAIPIGHGHLPSD